MHLSLVKDCQNGADIPVLEQDIAITNITLDILGQARLWYQLACDHSTTFNNEDDLAYLRDARNMSNLLLTEQPNGDWGQTIMRQYLYDAFKKCIILP
jgi:ring-1,2-phenylacetyl-CoA epoxidase subunit PaaC